MEHQRTRDFVATRLIRTERLFREERSGRGIGTGAAAAADGAVPARAALAFVALEVAQPREHRRSVPDLGERRRARVAGADRQISARIDDAFVRHEADARAGEASAR